MDRYTIRDIRLLKEMVVDMGRRVHGIFERSVEALLAGDVQKAKDVILADDEIDQLELDVDDQVERLSTMALVASDLRLIMAVSRITPELEHAADICQNIAERTIEVYRTGEPTPIPGLIRLMAGIADEMLGASLTALANNDASLAREIIERDSEVDALMAEALRELEATMTERPDQIPRGIRLTFVTKYLERIADTATHISEQIIYEAQGETVKHRALVDRNRVG